MLDKLTTYTGTWQGTNILQDPNSGQPEESPALASVTPVLDGRFVRLDYTWEYQGKAQAGSLLIGYEAKANVLTGQWIDTWHMGDKVMSCRSSAGESDLITLLGSFEAPPGPDWGWRTDLLLHEPDRLVMMMYAISPDEEESPAVEAKRTSRVPRWVVYQKNSAPHEGALLIESSRSSGFGPV